MYLHDFAKVVDPNRARAQHHLPRKGAVRVSRINQSSCWTETFRDSLIMVLFPNVSGKLNHFVFIKIFGVPQKNSGLFEHQVFSKFTLGHEHFSDLVFSLYCASSSSLMVLYMVIFIMNPWLARMYCPELDSPWKRAVKAK